MKVKVVLYVSLSAYMPENTQQPMELKEGITVGELLSDLKVPLEEVKLIFVNSVHGGFDTVLNDGDRVGVFPPVAGG